MAVAVLGWRFGLPALRIAELEQRVKLMETQLLTAKERALAAETREERCIQKLDAASAALTQANTRIAAFLTVLELKTLARTR